MSDSGNLDKKLNRDISRLGFSAISLNGVIGAGIFGLPAIAAARAGDFSPWMFVLCGLMTLTIVLSFARASSLVRQTGGVIVYAHHAFGPFAGFQAGWLSWLGRIASVAANSNLLVTYASWFWAPLDTEPWRSVALTALIGSLTWFNIIGVKNSIGIVYVLTAFKLLPLSLLILFGLGHIDVQALFGASVPSLDGFGQTVLVLMYAYVGFEGTVVTAGEGRNPRRDIPRALIQTILAIGVIYFLIQVVSMAALPDIATSKTALADVAAVLFGAIGAAVLTLGAVFSIGGNLMVSFLSATRMTWALGRDGSMPAWFAAVHDRHQTPHHSILFYGAISLALALSGTFIQLAVMSTVVRLVTYMISIAALPRLQKNADENEFRLPGGYLIPGIAMLLCIWLLTFASLDSWKMMGVFVLIGTVIYYWTQRQNAKAGGDSS